MDYTMSTSLNEERTPDKVVDQAFVNRFTNADTLAWFRNLGGTETVRRQEGRIYVVSTSPDGTKVRRTVFTPVPEAN